MDVNELARIVERLQAEGKGDAEILIPSQTGGFYSPYSGDEDPDDHYVYIQ